MRRALLDHDNSGGRYSTDTDAGGATRPTRTGALVDQRKPGLEVETAAEVGAAAEIAAEVSPAAVVTAVGAGIGAGVIGRGVG
jgi:hypothetical protein